MTFLKPTALHPATSSDPQRLRLAVLGAGSWGQALAAHWGHQHQVQLWGRQQRSSDFPLTLDLSAALDQAQLWVIASPSTAVLELAHRARACAGKARALLLTAKGLCAEPAGFLHQRLLEDGFEVALLSGPTFAAELARGLPSAAVIAAADIAWAAALARDLSTPSLRLYRSSDMTGVALGGALKNVLAIAAGLSDGLGFGANARAALIARGLAELSRLASALGAHSHTITGLSGLGDLVLTATSEQSRNYRLGRALGQGHSLELARAQLGAVAEGIEAAAIATGWARQHQISLPVCQQVAEVLSGRSSAHEAVAHLLKRELAEE